MIKINKPKPIKVELEGKRFTVKRLTQGMIDQVQEAKDGVEQAAIILGCSPAELQDMDLRVLSDFILQITEEITKDVNPPTADDKS